MKSFNPRQLEKQGKMKNLLKVLLLFYFLSIIGLHAQSHPYLLYTDANVSRLKSQIKSDKEIQYAWERVKSDAESMFRRPHLKAQDCETLGLAYRMTGDKRFGRIIKQILMNYAERETWEGEELLNRTPPWRAGLETSHTSFSIAIGYDCIYDDLSPQERQKIVNSIVKIGIKPAIDDWLNPLTNQHTFDTMGHNWWSACVYMAGFASLAVKEEVPEAESWAENIAETITEWVQYAGNMLQNKPYTFDRKGGYYESINYASYGLSQYLLFRYAFKNVLPNFKLPEVPMMNKIGDFFIQTTYYRNEGIPFSLNFGDGDVRENGDFVVSLLWNLGIHKDRYVWYLKKVNESNDKNKLYAPDKLILNPNLPDLPPDYKPDLPCSQLYPDMGWAVMRNSWDDNATFIGIKCGFTWNHAHADAGSFILFHNGKNLIIDSGNSSYSHPSYTQYYCQSVAHNVVLWNGKAQDEKDQYYGVSNWGKMTHLIDAGDYKYVMADATGPTARYFRRNHRHFLWIGDVILIIDELESYEPGIFEWLLHYNGVARRYGLDLSIKDGDDEIKVRPLYPNTFPNGGLPHDFPEKMKLKEYIGLRDHEPDQQMPYWSIYEDKITDKTTMVSAIILVDEKSNRKLPQIERFEGNDMLGISIYQKDKVTDLYINLRADGRIKHRNSLNSFKGWDTDAWLTAMTFEKGADRSDPRNVKTLFVADGSYVRNNGKPLIHALSKFFAVVEFNGNNRNVEFDGQNPVHINFFFEGKPQLISINGKEYSPEYYDVENKIANIYLR